MKPKDYFALALRVVGLLIAVDGLRYIVESFLGVLGYFTTQRTSYSFYFIMGMIQFFVGLYLLRGASVVVRFAYPERPEGGGDEVEELNEHNSAQELTPTDAP